VVLDVVGSNPTSRPIKSITYGIFSTNQILATENLDAMGWNPQRINKLQNNQPH
jgi:hypothetical protein